MSRDEFEAFSRYMELDLEMQEVKQALKAQKEQRGDKTVTKKFGDLTVRELWEICDKHPQCRCCPIVNYMCVGGAWPRRKEVLSKEVKL